ncbi:MAG: hypothetical protein AUK47_18290 [Deltaproteobacteria bacterium CG2_30_63_29]|nr:MAG: hypothetical protein AUK47_18290 [Deltaproteobacteria bacterium CG2_30_63_29]PJB47971.1 MAG: hypothetical protein CO108_03170 [Deltaproteobacteria bacterium CG_4_9_14_3_um_filter_63_12]
MKIRLALLLALLVSLFAFDAFAEEPAATPPAEEPAKVEKPAAGSGDYSHLTGTYSSEWGDVTLKFTGSHCEGAWSAGTFSGDVDANGVLKYKWTQPDGTGGYGVFNIEKDGKMLGRWGYGESSSNGGDWTLFPPK